MASTVILQSFKLKNHISQSNYFLYNSFPYGINKMILLSIFFKLNDNEVCMSKIKVKNNIKLPSFIFGCLVKFPSMCSLWLQHRFGNTILVFCNHSVTYNGNLVNSSASRQPKLFSREKLAKCTVTKGNSVTSSQVRFSQTI